MPEDYSAAAARHFRDGRLLEKNQRISNADQLFGFAAECAIKSALVGLPGFAAHGDLLREYQQHIDVLWGRVLLQSLQRRFRTLYAVLTSERKAFDDWSTGYRYGPDDAVTEGVLERHHRAAKRVLGSIGIQGTLAEG